MGPERVTNAIAEYETRPNRRRGVKGMDSEVGLAISNASYRLSIGALPRIDTEIKTGK
jgi:hypothetical protein